MVDEQPFQTEQIEFRYPKLLWVFVLACHIVMLVFFAAFTLGKVPLQFLWAYIVFIAAYIFLLGVHVWDWMGWIAGARRPIIIGAEGIKAGRKFAAWEQIEEVRHGMWLNRTGGIILKLKKQKRPFFEFTLKPKPKALFLQAYPFIYREFIPAIRTIRPDLPISPIVERAMKDPEGSIAPRRWLLAILLVVNIGLLIALLMPPFQSMLFYLFIPSALFWAWSFLMPWAFKLTYTERDKFIEFGFPCSILVSFSAGLRAFTPIEPVAVNTLIIAAITASALAFVVLFAVKEMTKYLKIFILCVLAGMPLGSYAYNRSQEWPSKNITELLCGDKIHTAAWGNCGKYITTAWYEGQGCVIDARTLERIFVPSHNGSISTIWLDEKVLIRRVTLENDNDGGFVRELWVYDFNQQQEFKVPTYRRFSIGTRRPVDVAGRHIAWIDYGRDGQTLKFCNLETMNEDMEAIELPKDVNWVGGQAVWTSEKELAVFVDRPDEECEDKVRRLYVSKVNLEDGGWELLKSSRKYESWNPVNDFQSAFGINEPKKFEKFSSYFLSLGKDEITPVAGDDFPLAAQEMKCAYHVVEEKTGAHLMRFDFESDEDQRLFPVPKAMRIQGVSPSGNFVLLGVSGFLNFPIYMFIDVNDCKQHWIYLSGMTSTRSPALIASIPGTSPFSADERRLILETISAEGIRTLLCEIPERW